MITHYWRVRPDPVLDFRQYREQRLRQETAERVYGTEPARSYPSPFEPSDDRRKPDGLRTRAAAAGTDAGTW
jgi:hypothetical protein